MNTELASAKALIGQLQANIDGGATAKTYAAVASTAAVTKSSNGTKRSPTSGGRRQPTPGSKANRKNEGEPVVQGEHVVSERVKVDGARRVWGTTMHTTTKSISNAISRLCKIEVLTIKRKTSNPSAMKKSWWFVIHADEALLHELHTKWASVNLQTSWLLQHCTKPVISAAGTATMQAGPTPDQPSLGSCVSDLAHTVLTATPLLPVSHSRDVQPPSMECPGTAAGVSTTLHTSQSAMLASGSTATGSFNNGSATTLTTSTPAGHVHHTSGSIVTEPLSNNNADASNSMVDNDTAVAVHTVTSTPSPSAE